VFSGLFTAFDAMIAVRDVARRFRAPAAKAALDRDRERARLELERAQLEEARRRAEAALELALRRTAVDRELSRLRLLAGIALIGWIASIVVLGIHAGMTSMAARVAVGAGWLLLLGAMATSFTAQGRVIACEFDRSRPIDSGAVPLWLLIAGLAVSAISLLV
jgi:hypothetical protein